MMKYLHFSPGDESGGAPDGPTSTPPATSGQDDGALVTDPQTVAEWNARLSGQSRVNSAQDVQIKSLTKQLTEVRTELATEVAKQGTTVAEWQGKVSALEARQKALEVEKAELEQANLGVSAELAKLRTLAAHPDLLVYADLIPATSDQALLDQAVLKLQAIHTQTRESARLQLQHQTITPPLAPPTPAPVPVMDEQTLGALQQKVNQARHDFMDGKISNEEFQAVVSEAGAAGNEMQQAK